MARFPLASPATSIAYRWTTCSPQLDRCDLVILDDIGYVQQDREEMEVLFTFLAERYERRSVAITSNLVFSQWDRIFKDAMTTAAAIDRLVHHAHILELTGKSYRAEAAFSEGTACRTRGSAAGRLPAGHPAAASSGRGVAPASDSSF